MVSSFFIFIGLSVYSNFLLQYMAAYLPVSSITLRVLRIFRTT